MTLFISAPIHWVPKYFFSNRILHDSEKKFSYSVGLVHKIGNIVLQLEVLVLLTHALSSTDSFESPVVSARKDFSSSFCSSCRARHRRIRCDSSNYQAS